MANSAAHSSYSGSPSSSGSSSSSESSSSSGSSSESDSDYAALSDENNRVSSKRRPKRSLTLGLMPAATSHNAADGLKPRVLTLDANQRKAIKGVTHRKKHKPPPPKPLKPDKVGTAKAFRVCTDEASAAIVAAVRYAGPPPGRGVPRRGVPRNTVTERRVPLRGDSLGVPRVVTNVTNKPRRNVPRVVTNVPSKPTQKPPSVIPPPPPPPPQTQKRKKQKRKPPQKKQNRKPPQKQTQQQPQKQPRKPPQKQQKQQKQNQTQRQQNVEPPAVEASPMVVSQRTLLSAVRGLRKGPRAPPRKVNYGLRKGAAAKRKKKRKKKKDLPVKAVTPDTSAVAGKQQSENILGNILGNIARHSASPSADTNDSLAAPRDDYDSLSTPPASYRTVTTEDLTIAETLSDDDLTDYQLSEDSHDSSKAPLRSSLGLMQYVAGTLNTGETRYISLKYACIERFGSGAWDQHKTRVQELLQTVSPTREPELTLEAAKARIRELEHQLAMVKDLLTPEQRAKYRVISQVNM